MRDAKLLRRTNWKKLTSIHLSATSYHATTCLVRIPIVEYAAVERGPGVDIGLTIFAFPGVQSSQPRKNSSHKPTPKHKRQASVVNILRRTCTTLKTEIRVPFFFSSRDRGRIIHSIGTFCTKNGYPVGLSVSMNSTSSRNRRQG